MIIVFVIRIVVSEPHIFQRERLETLIMSIDIPTDEKNHTHAHLPHAPIPALPTQRSEPQPTTENQAKQQQRRPTLPLPAFPPSGPSCDSQVTR